MKFLISIILFCGLIATIRAAISHGFYKDSKYPGKCVVGDLILSPGEQAKNPFSSCGRMLCGADGHVEFQTCGSQGAPTGYKLGDPVYPTADYPKCCEKKYIPI